MLSSSILHGGGPNYKDLIATQLSISGLSISELVNQVLDKVRLIVIKVPTNYDFSDFFNEVDFENAQINIHSIEKFYLVCVLNKTYLKNVKFTKN